MNVVTNGSGFLQSLTIKDGSAGHSVMALCPVIHVSGRASSASMDGLRSEGRPKGRPGLLPSAKRTIRPCRRRRNKLHSTVGVIQLPRHMAVVALAVALAAGVWRLLAALLRYHLLSLPLTVLTNTGSPLAILSPLSLPYHTIHDSRQAK